MTTRGKVTAMGKCNQNERKVINEAPDLSTLDALLLLSSPGCWDLVELKRIGLVTIVGIDYDTQDGLKSQSISFSPCR